MYDLKATRLSLTNLAVNQFLLKEEIDPVKYEFTSFFESYTINNSIKVDQNIPIIDEQFFLGITVRSPYSTAIFLNPRVYKRRQNFSACHELIHCLFDMNYREPSQSFFNVENRDQFYSMDEIKMEKLADCGAGVILLPDIKLVHYMKTNKSFPMIADECKMSSSALHNRLIDFGVYTCGMSNEVALRSTNELRYKGSRVGFRFYLTGNHLNREKQIIYDYENAIYTQTSN